MDKVRCHALCCQSSADVLFKGCDPRIIMVLITHINVVHNSKNINIKARFELIMINTRELNNIKIKNV